MFSVIIPVHNAEKTLRKCLDSLTRQTYGDFEVLLIENGSTDDSLLLCREYESKDNRFKVFDIGMCNGPSKPRNYGLDHAEGDYIAFVDSDDWIETNHLQLFEKVLKEVDLAICGYSLDDEKGKCIKKICPGVETKDKIDQCYELINADCFGYSCCIGYLKKKYADIRFDESINLFEDLVFTSELVRSASKLGIISHYTYHYVQVNPLAITKTMHYDMIYKKDMQFKAQYSLLKNDYMDYLIRFANDCVSFCVNYTFENHFSIRNSFNSIKQTDYYRIAKEKPNKWTILLTKGYFVFLINYYKYRIKRIFYDILH